MKLKRLFSTAEGKGTENYLQIQRKYELFRTLLYFTISLSLFFGGWIQTGNRTNLLSIVAILGCLPASKSAVSTIMFFRFKSAKPETVNAVKEYSNELPALYDCVFTAYKSNYVVAHLVVKNHTICGYSEDKGFPETAFYTHIQDLLRLDGHRDITVKIFTDLKKYTDRLEQLGTGEDKSSESTYAILDTLKHVML